MRGQATLEAYLDRIGWTRTPRLDEDTLIGVHRAHITTIAFENLDMQLGRKKVLSEDVFYNKLILEGRGGWCYETNGLLTRALGCLGFTTMRVAGALRRELRGDETLGNHLIGMVDLERRWVVDVGLLDGPLEPFPLEERRWREGCLEFKLERIEGGWWRFHNHQHDSKSCDFREQARTLESFKETSHELQTAATSPFVQYAIAGRRFETGYDVLRDVDHFHVEDGELTRRKVVTKAEYEALLRDILGEDIGEEGGLLWERVERRARAR